MHMLTRFNMGAPRFLRTTAAALAVSLGVCLATAPAMAAPITLTITDNSANETVSLGITGDAGANTTTTILGTESFTYTAPLFPVHPPMTAFARFNLFEPDGVNATLSDTIEITMTPNNDATTSTFVMTFRSDPDAVTPLSGAGTQNVVELAAGNPIITENSGLRDANGNLIPVTSIGGGPLTVTVISDINPVPEPSSIVLAALAVPLLVLLRRRRATA